METKDKKQEKYLVYKFYSIQPELVPSQEIPKVEKKKITKFTTCLNGIRKERKIPKENT